MLLLRLALVRVALSGKLENVNLPPLPSLWDRLCSLLQQVHSLALALYKIWNQEINLHEMYGIELSWFSILSETMIDSRSMLNSEVECLRSVACLISCCT